MPAFQGACTHSAEAGSEYLGQTFHLVWPGPTFLISLHTTYCVNQRDLGPLAICFGKGRKENAMTLVKVGSTDSIQDHLVKYRVEYNGILQWGQELGLGQVGMYSQGGRAQGLKITQGEHQG